MTDRSCGCGNERKELCRPVPQLTRGAQYSQSRSGWLLLGKLLVARLGIHLHRVRINHDAVAILLEAGVDVRRKQDAVVGLPLVVLRLADDQTVVIENPLPDSAKIQPVVP